MFINTIFLLLESSIVKLCNSSNIFQYSLKLSDFFVIELIDVSVERLYVYDVNPLEMKTFLASVSPYNLKNKSLQNFVFENLSDLLFLKNYPL